MKIEFIPLKNTSDVPPSYCTRCMRKNDQASAVNDPDSRPSPGDYTLCLYCGNIMRFDDLLALRDPTPEEMLELKRSDLWAKVKDLQGKFRNAVYAGAFKKDRP